MASKPFIAARIPEDLSLKLEDYSKTTGESRTQIIINALSTYIGWSRSEDKGTAASGRLAALEQRVLELERLVKEPKQISLLEGCYVPGTAESLSKKEESEPVIKIDNSFDNGTNKSLITTTERPENHPAQQRSRHIGQMKTKDIPGLPGLENEDIKRLKNKLNNTKKTASKTTQIGPYNLVLTLLDTRGTKQEFLWDVYKTEDTNTN